MPAMHMNMCRNYKVTGQLIDFYRERALGGAGLIVSATRPSTNSQEMPVILVLMMIHSSPAWPVSRKQSGREGPGPPSS